MSKILKLLFLTLLVLFAAECATAQKSFVAITVSNNTTGLPVISYPKLFYSQFHPGIEASYGWQINGNANNKVYVTGNLGYYYHQFVQSLVKLYPALIYERAVSDRLNLSGGLGGGFGISFEGKNAFKLQQDGSYVNKGFLGARSQYLIALELGATYSLSTSASNGPSLVIQLKSFMQGTYVKSYVPLLPLNSINIGVRIPLKSK